MKRLVYTAVFNGYDRVYPPVVPENGVDYVIVTDEETTSAPGWRTVKVDTSRFKTPKEANLYHRALIHRILPGYDASLYVDGNIRLLGPSLPLFEELIARGAAVMMHRHPLRSSVAEEILDVVDNNKIVDYQLVKNELDDYCRDGFPDNVGMGETGVMLKNHHHQDLDSSMELWWKLFKKYSTRDQISFPYVVWKFNLDIIWISTSFRQPNPYFALYPHIKAKNVNPMYAHISARSHDNIGYWLLFTLWHIQWHLRREGKKKISRMLKISGG